jgi:acetyltransferase
VSAYGLDKVFNARSVALVGVSQRERSLGRLVLDNLRRGGFSGPIHIVHPKHKEIDGISTVPSLGRLGEVPDLVVVTTGPAAVPQIVAEAAAKGVGATVIITAGLGHGPGSLAEQCVTAAKPHGLRIIGPNVLGLLIPQLKLNASFAASSPKAGNLALVSQSGAIAAGLIEWSIKHSVGFSGIVSLGDAVDVDFGDLLDHFALDAQTKAILLYIEAVTAPAKFLSAARAAARVKPVIAIKAGRQAQGAKAAATHTGALAGSDAVYDAVLRRAGILRVMELEDLFVAAEALARTTTLPGPNLGILTNGGGVGVLAVDHLIELGGTLSDLSADTIGRLGAFLPSGWSGSNPVDIIGDADGDRYAKSLEVLLSDPGSDAVLVLNVATALAAPVESARSVAKIVGENGRGGRAKPVFTGWIAESSEAAKVFEEANIPHYATESDAVEGFIHLVHFGRTRQELMETPPAVPSEFEPDVSRACRAMERALAEGGGWLNTIEIGELLSAYAIRAVEAVLAKDGEDAHAKAATLLARYSTLAAKIVSGDIVHKSDIGGVLLNLNTAERVQQAADEIFRRAKEKRPAARIQGILLQPMIVRPQAHELIAGIAEDPTFGPIIAFGAGGTAVEIIGDKALGLPPLDLRCALDLVSRTRVSRLLSGYRNVQPADRQEIALTLVKLSQMAADLPELREVDLNPLLADCEGVMALDARAYVSPVKRGEQRTHGSRLSIRPYPSGWRRQFTLSDRTNVLMRPIKPEDEPALTNFFSKVTENDLRLRFFGPVRTLTHSFLARLTQIDYGRAMAFVAIAPSSEILGIVNLFADSAYVTGEFAVIVRSDIKGRGLGWALMRLILDYAKAEGLKAITGQILRENRTMITMSQELGFSIESLPGLPNIVRARFDLAKMR